MTIKYSLSAIVILLVAFPIEAKRDYILEVLEAKTDIGSGDCVKTLTANVKNNREINVDMEFRLNVTEWSMKLILDLLTKNNRRISLINVEGDVCKLLEEASRNILVTIIFKEMLRSSNIGRKCPLFANVLYAVRSYTLVEERFPNIFRPAYWIFDMNSTFNKKFTATLSVKGRTKKL